MAEAAVPKQFIDESAANMGMLQKAFESVSLAQIASDWAGDMSMAGLDIKKIADDMGSTVRSLQQSAGAKKWPTTTRRYKRKGATEDAPFDEEDVAIEVEYLEESQGGTEGSFDDPMADLGICALADTAVGLEDEDDARLWGRNK